MAQRLLLPLSCFPLMSRAVEGEMKEVSEAEMMEAITVGHDAIKKQVELQLALAYLRYIL